MFSLTEQFKSAMREFPAGVTIIATGSAPYRSGLTATAVCSLTAEPPQITACVNASTETFRMIHSQRCFSMNILSTSQKSLARRFGGLEPRVMGDSKFDNTLWRSGELNVPILQDCIVAFECDLVDAIRTETHVILIGAVKRIHKSAGESTLMYGNGSFGQLVHFMET